MSKRDVKKNVSHNATIVFCILSYNFKMINYKT